MTKLIFSFALILISTRVLAQSNVFPLTGNAGIGTLAPVNALQILHATGAADTAFIRLSNGGSPTSTVFGLIGLMPATYPYYSSLSTGEDLIIHEHSQGDLILTNFQSRSLSHPYGAIRFATTPDTGIVPIGTPVQDFERFSILPNGNIGIDIPPNSNGLDSAVDQLQLGGGVTPYPGNTYPTPGLTFYGGNRFENNASLTNWFKADYRYMAFNKWIDHTDSSSHRAHRFQPIASSEIDFAENAGGILQLTCSPFDTTKTLSVAMTDFSKHTTLQISGNQGLALWYMDSNANPYHHLFDIFLPGQHPYGVTRNTNGLAFFHTPVCITSDSGGVPLIDFTNFASVSPRLGDGHTWLLAVNGPALFKEAYVSLDWPDYVFQSDYKLRSIDEFGNYLEARHHLPDIASADSMKAGVPLGETEKELTQQVEEMALYIVQLNKEVEALKTQMKDLKKVNAR